MVTKPSEGNGEASKENVNLTAMKNAVQGLRSMAESQKRYFAFGTKAYPQIHAYLSQMETQLGIDQQPGWGTIPPHQ